MKNKINTIFSSALIALTIVLFLPSASQATGHHHSHFSHKCAKYSTLIYKYDSLHQRFPHNFFYVKLANKYKSRFNRYCTIARPIVVVPRPIVVPRPPVCPPSVVCPSVVCPPVVVPPVVVPPVVVPPVVVPPVVVVPDTGNLFGNVYEDINKNGDLDNAEIGANGILVTITDSNGTITSLVTTDGSYAFAEVSIGTVEINITNLPENAIVIDGDSLNYTAEVLADTENDAGDTGYVFAEVIVETGTIVGSVYDDKNENGNRDEDEDREDNITITMTDSEGTVQTTVADKGFYIFDDVAVGSVDINITGLPMLAIIEKKDINFVTTVEADAETKLSTGYTIPDPLTITVTVEGSVYEDLNFNGIEDKNETSPDTIEVKLTDSTGAVFTTNTSNGTYSFDNVAEGEISIEITNIPEDAFPIENSFFTFTSNTVEGEITILDPVGYVFFTP